MLTSTMKAHGYCGIDLTCELTCSPIDKKILEDGEIDGQEQMSYTYGILVLDRDENVVMRKEDISSDRRLVEGLIALLDSGVSAVHILDVLEDYLID